MMSLQRNYYEVLGLPPAATTDQIKKKYRELARKFHPDVVQDKVMGQRVFTQINQAYSVLGNPERRAQYNNTLQAGPSSNGTTSNGTAPNGSAANGTAASNGTAPASAPKAEAPQAAAPKPSAAMKPQAFAEMLGRAENAIMASKPVEARAFCVRILEADPRNVKALEILGDALVQMGRRDEAAVQYRQALQVGPSSLIQAKLNRVAPPQAAARTAASPSAPRTTPPPRTPPPPAVQNGNGTQRTVRPESNATEETEKPGGLLGRLLGRK